MKGQYIAPGFIDFHFHIESSMVTIPEYAKFCVSMIDTAMI